MLLKFTFKNIGSHQETVIQEDFALDIMFFDVLKQILQRYLLGISLDQITVITQSGDYLKNEDLIKPVMEIIEENQVEFTIVKREEVNGPILIEPVIQPISEILKPKIDSFEAETIEKAKIAEEDQLMMGKRDERPRSIERIMQEEIESKKKEIEREMVTDMEGIGHFMEKKLVYEKEEEITMQKAEQKEELPTVNDKGSGLGGDIRRREDLKTTAPASLSMPSPQPAPPSPPIPAPKIASGSTPFPPPSPVSTGMPAPPSPEPLAPMPSPPPAGSMGSPPPLMAKEASLPRKMRHEKAKIEVRAKRALRDEVAAEEDETSEVVLELKEEIAQEYTKHLSIEYFDRMNPEKYYPLIVDIADVQQVLKAAEENIFTGERKIQKQEDMTVMLKSTIVSVEPLFPGCVVTPPMLTTDFSLNQDIITFYITPLVSDELKECKIQFLDSEKHVIYSIATPTKVDDPRYAKTIATYGTIVSILPKALILFGIDIGETIELTTILPFIKGTFGSMKLLNFIGIAGAILFILIGVIIYLKRRPRKVKRSFKVGDIRSVAATLIKEIIK